jgi:hypothetical protein
MVESYNLLSSSKCKEMEKTRLSILINLKTKNFSGMEVDSPTLVVS